MIDYRGDRQEGDDPSVAIHVHSKLLWFQIPWFHSSMGGITRLSANNAAPANATIPSQAPAPII